MSLDTTTARPASLLATVAPRGGLMQAAACAVFGSLLLALSAKVQVPMWPVPMTMQTMVVLLIGMAYGSRLGAATVLLYLAEGMAGLPVFAGPSAGPAYMMGPTAGYLVGFVAGAYLTGLLAERGWDRTPVKALVAMTVGHAAILALGVLWLATLVGFDAAIVKGLTPFWAATALKTALGAAVMQAAWTVVKRRSLV